MGRSSWMAEGAAICTVVPTGAERRGVEVHAGKAQGSQRSD